MNTQRARSRNFWFKRILVILAALLLINCGDEGKLLTNYTDSVAGTFSGDTDSAIVGDSDRDTHADTSVPPLDILNRYTPTDEDAAKKFQEYLSEELGVLTYGTEGTGNARMITQTIFIPPNTTYDGKGEVLTADANVLLCDTIDGESNAAQPPVFILAPGAGLKNVTITAPGCEGIHMFGNNVLDNITWEDVGEDAASVRSYFPGGTITIINSEANHADQMFQFNTPCDVRIENFIGDDMSKFVRGNGDWNIPLNLDLNTVNITNVSSAVVQSDSPLCKVRYHDLTYSFTESGDMSDQVFNNIPPENITKY